MARNYPRKKTEIGSSDAAGDAFKEPKKSFAKRKLEGSILSAMGLQIPKFYPGLT